VLEARPVGWVEEVAAEEPLGDIVQVTAVTTGEQRGKRSPGRFVCFIEQFKRTNKSGT